MGSGRAGRHHDAIEPLCFDFATNDVLGVLGAGEQVVGHIGHIGQGAGIVPHRGHIHHAADVDAAVADENARRGAVRRATSRSAGASARTVSVWRPAARSAAGAQGRAAGLHHRLGDILGPGEGAADINAGPGGGHGPEIVDAGKAAGAQFNAQLLTPLAQILRGLQPHRQDDQVEQSLPGHGRLQRDSAATAVRSSRSGCTVWTRDRDEAHAVLVTRFVVTVLESLPWVRMSMKKMAAIEGMRARAPWR